jgi:hypothetical protein
MTQNTNKCPVCPRGCDLSSPSCKRGEEYAKTGEMPKGDEHSHHHHTHGGHHRHHMH